VDLPVPHLRVHAAADANGTFCAWRVAGRKQLTLRGRALVFESAHLANRVRAHLDPEVREGAGMALSVALTDSLRSRLPAFEAQAAMLRGRAHAVRSRECTRAGLLHLRALQALDGQQEGASHRDIAEAVFGEDAVRARWSADGELRAQVRHLLSRARGFVDGGYRGLVAVST
jgi:hypothetical protein